MSCPTFISGSLGNSVLWRTYSYVPHPDSSGCPATVHPPPGVPMSRDAARTSAHATKHFQCSFAAREDLVGQTIGFCRLPSSPGLPLCEAGLPVCDGLSIRLQPDLMDATQEREIVAKPLPPDADPHSP
jgi:hypothetical protein